MTYQLNELNVSGRVGSGQIGLTYLINKSCSGWEFLTCLLNRSSSDQLI